MYYNGSEADVIEASTISLTDYISDNNITIKYYTPLFSSIGECKSVIKKICNTLEKEFKNVRGIEILNINDDDLKEFYSHQPHNEGLNIGLMDATKFDREEEEFYNIIDETMNKVIDKFKNSGLCIDYEFDKYDGMIWVYFNYKTPLHEFNIFSTIRFI